MSSLLLQSVSNALLRSAQEGGDVPMDAAAGAVGGALPMEGAAPAAGAAAPGGFDAAAALAAAGQLQLPAHFQDAVAAALVSLHCSCIGKCTGMPAGAAAGSRACGAGCGTDCVSPSACSVRHGSPQAPPPLASAPNLSLQGDDPLSTAAVDISVLRSFLDMLSSGGITPLPSGQAGDAPAAGEAAAPAVHDPAHVPPLSVAATGMGGSGSGSGGSGHMGGAFSAFKPTGSGSGGNGAAVAGGGLGSGGAKPDS